MEHQLWASLQHHLADLPSRFNPHYTYTDHDIARVFFWAVLHDRPTCWACSKKNWPPHSRQSLPSPSQMSRRLRSPRVLQLLQSLEERVLRPNGHPPLVWMVDGKPLPIGAASKDRQAGYGRAVRGKAKGYKLHALVGADNTVLAWRLAPMNTDERVMARRMLRGAEAQGYVVGDSNYDSNPLHDLCGAKPSLQLVTPRHNRAAKGLGHHRHSPGRLRSLELLSNPVSNFGRELLKQRKGIERYFGQLTSFGGGLSGLPAWVRTYRRVRRWVQAKLILNALRMQLRSKDLGGTGRGLSGSKREPRLRGGLVVRAENAAKHTNPPRKRGPPVTPQRLTSADAICW
jgi:hypothetical protein